MKQLIEFPMENGEVIWVEVELPETTYGDSEAAVSDLPTRASQTFQEAIAMAKPIAETILNKLSNLSERPQEIDVEFGLKLDAQAGAVISSSGLEANFKVLLKWKKE